MTDIAGWVAPIATMIAAMMTAANLGARLTGWGFVVFTVGSVCWTIIGLGSGQTNLVATNAFLTLVNGVGIWRWLGRQRVYEDGGKSAVAASRRSAAPSLFSATGVGQMSVVSKDGIELGKAVEALIECSSGKVSYVVLASGGVAGVAEVLRAVPSGSIEFGSAKLIVDMTADEVDRLPALDDGDWPALAPENDMAAA